MLVLEMNDAGRCWDIDTHAYGWAQKIMDAAHINSRLHAERPGRTLTRDQGQHTQYWANVHTYVSGWGGLVNGKTEFQPRKYCRHTLTTRLYTE